MIIRIHKKVMEALAENVGVVALESTIITHGMPYPENIETAVAVEDIITMAGCVPATIAVFEGELRIGLDKNELEALAQAHSVMKLSRADLAFAISSHRTGSTTVAATMIAAQLAGIKYFATGGIGGVHRGAAESMDISADLAELGKTSVNVVCAGPKAILDIQLTLEVLETEGVPVITYQSDELPAFWSQSSGIKSPLRLDSVQAIDEFVCTRERLGLAGGTLIANPVPADVEIPRSQMEKHIRMALDMAREANIIGKATTPFILSAINDLTAGESLSCNIALIKSNALLASMLAAYRADR